MDALEKVPTQFSKNLAKVFLHWAQEGAEIFTGIQKGLLDPEQMSVFMLRKAGFVEVLAKKSDEMSLDDFHRLIEAISGTPGLARKHADLAADIGADKYEFFIDQIIAIQNNSDFARNGLTAKDVAAQVSHLLASFSDKLRVGAFHHNDHIQETSEGLAWMVCKSDIKDVSQMRDFFITYADHYFFMPPINIYASSMTLLLRNNPENKVAGLNELMNTLMHEGVDLEIKTRMMSKLDLMGFYVDKHSLAIHHVDLMEIGRDLPIFRGIDTDYLPIGEFNDFAESTRCATEDACWGLWSRSCLPIKFNTLIPVFVILYQTKLLLMNSHSFSMLPIWTSL